MYINCIISNFKNNISIHNISKMLSPLLFIKKCIVILKIVL